LDTGDKEGEKQKKLPKKFIDLVVTTLDILSLTGVSASMTAKQKSILAPLAIEHLQMTREQLQMALMGFAVEAEMVAFVPAGSSNPHHKGHSLAGQLDLGSLDAKLVGQVDHRVIPISIHIPLGDS
ncbi:MAG: hypothetical protein OXH85_07390, partial [Truepera sp.]|nr:hypothetical protein [Truepera sp.]